MYSQLLSDGNDFASIYYMLMGMMLITVVFMLIHYLILKRGYFLFYGLCLFCLFLNYFLKTPFFYTIYSDWHSLFYFYFNQNSLLFGNFFYMLFIRSFTDMKNNYPQLYPLYNLLAVFFAIFILVYSSIVFINPDYIYNEIILESFLMIISLIALGFMITMIIKKQLIYTTVVLIGAILLLVGQIMSAILGQFFIMIPIIIVETIIFTGVITFLDFKNFKKAMESEQLKRITQFKNQFLANISHEFRTPLTLISYPINEMLESSDLSSERRSHFEMASKHSKRLLSLVNQLLDISKLDSDSFELRLEKGTPIQLIAAWSESFSFLANKKGIDFSLDIDNKEHKAWFDKDVLEKIITNLLGNAVKYTPEKGQISVKLRLVNEKLYFIVKNTGKGLVKHQIDNVFNRFYQGNNLNAGVGIGLSLTKELVETHKGTIKVNSIPNEWTTFEVMLNMCKNKFENIIEKIDTLDNEQIISTSLDLNRVQKESQFAIEDLPILLIVEDNMDVQRLLTNIFKPSYNITTAVNGKEGVAKALEQIPDIIISDVMMPIINGVELTSILKEDERTSHIPIVLLTAMVGDENKLTGINKGADDYIEKPFNEKLLKAKVESLIALRKKLRNRYSQEIILRPKDIAVTTVDQRFLERVQKVLDDKLTESTFNSEAFSKHVNMSRMQLHRKLKALTGLTTSEFLRSQRLKLSTQILKESDMSISEVGYSVGFNDRAYFAKCFKDVYSCTPSEYVLQTSQKL